MKKCFRKVLSANDVGATGTHQAGMLVPKSAQDLLAFLPPLDPGIKNSDAWLECVDEEGNPHRFRFVYYNNRFHDAGGTRNEYRITYMTSYLRNAGAQDGDVFLISRTEGDRRYQIRVERAGLTASEPPNNEIVPRIKLRAGWQRIH